MILSTCQSSSLALESGMRRSCVRRATPMVRRNEPRFHARPFCLWSGNMRDMVKKRASEKKYRQMYPDKIRQTKRRYRETHGDILKENDRKYFETHKELRAKCVKEYAQRNPEKIMAKEKARWHVTLAEKCEHCGSRATERHHSDYSKPLDVMHLCRACHVRMHYPSLKALV